MPETMSTDLNITRPTHFGWRIWWGVLRRVMAQSDQNNIGLVAAGVAFYALLSVFPALAALIALWGYVSDPVVLQEHLDVAQDLLPEDAFNILSTQVGALIAANRSTLQLTSLISIGVAVWTARNGVAALIRGLNAIYRESHRANIFRRYAVAVLLTVVLIFVGIFAFALVVVLPAILAFLPLGGLAQLGITVTKWLVVLAVVLFGICLLYRYGPNRRGARRRWITPGALSALVIWAVGSAAFSIYLRNFSNFNEVYGSLGAVIALLFWLYISAYVVLLGAQLNAELELSTMADSTVGQRKEPGFRKAFVADHVVDNDGRTRLADSLPEPEEPTEPSARGSDIPKGPRDGEAR